MLSKSVIFLCIASTFAYNLRITPQELERTWNDIKAEVKGNQHEAMIILRAATLQILLRTDDAKQVYIGNLTEAAKPYWSKIADLQKEAKAKGLDIANCVDLGNKQLYSLNESLAEEGFTKVDDIKRNIQVALGNDQIPTFVLDDISVYEKEVEACTDETCATEVQVEILQFYKKATDAIDNALKIGKDLINIKLTNDLASVEFDDDSYQQKYEVFLQDIESCIGKL